MENVQRAAIKAAHVCRRDDECAAHTFLQLRTDDGAEWLEHCLRVSCHVAN